MNFPSGCRIVFNVPNPAANALAVEDVLEARSVEWGINNEIRVLNHSLVCIRTVNFANVLIISPLVTVGSSHA